MTFTAKQRAAIKSWIGTAGPVTETFFRSVERRWMDPDDVLSGEGTVASGGRFAAVGVRAVYLSTTDTGASKETTARKSRLGGSALISTAKYPRVVFAVTARLERVLRLESLGSSGPGGDVRKACLDESDLTASVYVATQLEKAGIQGVIFPSVVEGGDDNLIVYVANCKAGALRIQNEDEFIQEATKIAAKRQGLQLLNDNL
ncbi:RES family NAD+ phosphorylase [Granulicella tundricola]|uniref:RES domain protein n=1 Tax=Granulicella tundricola (strain ATCC BAA-1859 / DSM 23138 / MP5ACTX9) TaxID=1198114 RepID=E8WWC9_GRATM|nr:RES family NAD+ phosphorylase [Granulicella tundricola]ADW68512.1 RES domain protein [Granulicella tundricola MP5ACTX9]